MQTSRVREALGWSHHILYPKACRKRAGMPSNGFVGWSIVPTGCLGRNLGHATACQLGLRPPGSRRAFRCTIRGAAVAKGAQAQLSGKREGVPGLSERSSELRYVGISVIWRRRDAKTLRPAGHGRIVDRLDIDGMAL
jgi:hypothetical protein